MPRPLLEMPPDTVLAPERARLLLERLGAAPPSSAALRQGLELTRQVEDDWDGWPPGWKVGGARVAFHGYREIDPRELRCTCGAPAPCAHMVAVLMVTSWQDPAHRELLSRPAWEVRLQGLVPEAVEVVEEQRNEGWVRYELSPPSQSDRVLPLQRTLVRLSRRDGAELKPQPFPATWEAAQARVLGLRPVDRQIHDALVLWSDLADPGRSSRFRDRGQATRRLLRQLRDQVLAGLSRVRDLRVGEDPVTVVLAPLTPQVRARTVAGGLQLSWDPPVRMVWPEAGGVVLVEGDVLRPLAEEALDPSRRLPAVPESDVEDFVSRWVIGARLPVELPTALLHAATEPGEPQARLELREEGEALVIEARFAYRVGEAEGLVAPEERGAYVRLTEEESERRGPPRVCRRDRLWEHSQLATLDHLPELPARLLGDEALDWLSEGLPQARSDGWEVFGREGLLRHRLVGTLRPTVERGDGHDWFSLELRFEHDDVRLPTASILESWLEGRRYVRLSDGTMARLPERWLRRHGRAAVDWVDANAHGPPGPWAAPLAKELLEEDPTDVPWQDWNLRGPDAAQREVPDTVVTPLRPYQQVGFSWLCFLRDHGLSGCLADDMGLGKTLQALALLADTHRTRGAPSLVVAPTSVLSSWRDQARLHTPSLRVTVHHGANRASEPQAFDDLDLVITSYGVLRGDEALLRMTAWRTVVLDEAHRVKNPTSQTARAARGLRPHMRLALTGTPVENDLIELWSLFHVLMPGFFGSRERFQKSYATPIRKGADPDALVRLRQRIAPFLLRRDKQQVATDLPPREEVVETVPLGEAQRQLYERVRATWLASLSADQASGMAAGTLRLHVLEALTRLRQACCHPDLLPFPEARVVTESAKVERLLTLLDEAVAGGHAALVFSQWPRVLHRVAEALDARRIGWVLLEGSTPARKRATLVESFQQPDGPPVFLLSLMAGGTGLTLTRADLVFHLDPWWNPQVEAQATDRAHRIGQTRPVTSYRLVAEDTVEQRILELQRAKQALFDGLLEEGRAAEWLTTDRLLSLVGETR